MTTKFYLHNVSSGVAGTLPAAGASVSSVTPTQIVSGGVNKSMDGTIGALQIAATLTTLAQTTAQSGLIARFVSPLLAAQTIAAQQIIARYGASESNANSDFFPTWTLATWRPSTGAIVNRMWDGVASGAEPGTSEADQSVTATLAQVTASTILAGDVLVLELWRGNGTQGMGVAYTNTYFYDGTTEGSATTNAAYLLFANDVALYVPKSLAHPRDLTRGLTLRPRRRRAA